MRVNGVTDKFYCLKEDLAVIPEKFVNSIVFCQLLFSRRRVASYLLICFQNFKDLLSDEPFTRSDIIVLQDPRYCFLEILGFYYFSFFFTRDANFGLVI
jgi:hypothetical protein